MEAVGQALKAYRQPESWRCLMANGMAKDLSWAQSARRFSEIYRSLTPSKRAISNPAQTGGP